MRCWGGGLAHLPQKSHQPDPVESGYLGLKFLRSGTSRHSWRAGALSYASIEEASPAARNWRGSPPVYYIICLIALYFSSRFSVGKALRRTEFARSCQEMGSLRMVDLLNRNELHVLLLQLPIPANAGQ